MAANEFQKRIAKEVLTALAEKIRANKNIDLRNQSSLKFDERTYSQVLYLILLKDNVVQREAKAYQWRAIKPLIEKGFSTKIAKAIAKLPEQKELSL